MKAITKEIKKLWKDESGQGMTEYILILLIVIAIAVMFKDQIKNAIGGKIGDLAGELQSFSAN